jgi:hypothetical protein
MNSKPHKPAAWLLGLCLMADPVSAADPFWNGDHAYLGETRPDDTPRVFAPGKLAEPGTITMGRSAFSRDGRDFYFTQNDSWESAKNAKLRMVRFTNGGWSTPRTIAVEAMSPTLSIDEQSLFMRKRGMTQVWVSRRTREGWGEAALFLERKQGLYDFMPTASGQFYVGSEPTDADKARGSTYVISLLTPGQPEPRVQSLGAPLNGPGFNGDFFIAPDESYMVLSANVTADFESEAHIAFRKADGTWTRPVSLGHRINHDRAHRWGYYVPASGDYLFYSHGTSASDCAVHWVRFRETRERLQREALGVSTGPTAVAH